MRDLAKGLRRDDPREYARLMRAFAHGIFELKTRGGVRVLYFFDEGRVVVWSGASLWPSSAPLARGGAISTTGAAAPCGSWRISD